MGRSLARASAFLAFWLLRAAAQQREVPPLQQTIKTPSLDADVTNPTGEEMDDQETVSTPVPGAAVPDKMSGEQMGDQETVPTPLLGANIPNIFGFDLNNFPQNLTTYATGPLYTFFTWLTRVDSKFGELEPPILLRGIAGSGFTCWEALAPYTEKSVGLFLGGTLRRPLEEHTIENKNLAIAHAMYRFAMFMMPLYEGYWRETMAKVKFEVDTDNVDPTSPIGIGNLAGLAVIRFLSTDGYNQLGDLTPDGGWINGNTYNRWNYSDYTLFEPANGAYRITDPTKWQPLVIESTPPFNGGSGSNFGAPYIQMHITPHIGNAKRVSYKGNISAAYDIPPPIASMDASSSAYKEQVDDVLAYSAGLTDVQKLQAEHFDSKIRSLGSPLVHLAVTKKLLTLERIIFVKLVGDMALLDGNSHTWGQKIRFNAPRPITAIRYLYGEKNISAWGGPYKGTQTLTGKQYRSYIKTMQHADYPSGSACYCSVLGSALREIFGSDEFGFTFTFPKGHMSWEQVSEEGKWNAGSSAIEPGKVPAEDTTLYWPTFSDYQEKCEWSRVLGGVHFRPAVIQASKLCAPIGKAAARRAKDLQAGIDNGPIDITTVQ